MAEPRSVPGHGQRPSGSAAPAPASTPPGSRPSRCSRRCGSTRPTPTSCCPPCCGHYGLAGRDAAFATELASGTHPDARAPTTPSSPPASTGRCARSRPRCSTRCAWAPTSCCRCGCPTTPPSAPPSTWSAPPCGAGAGELRQRGAAQGRRPRPRHLGRPGGARRRAATPTSTPPSPTATRPGWSTSSRAALGGRASELPTLLAADNVAPAVTLVARPGSSTRDGAARRAHAATRRTAWCSPAVPPARCPPCARAAPACRTRARSWSRSPWPPARRRRAATSAGSTCAPAPGGKAALLAALAAERGAALVAAERQPHRAAARRPRAGAGVPSGVPGVVTADGHTPPFRARQRSTGCWSTRPAPAWARCAAARRPAGARKPDDLLALVMLQRALVASALRPGPPRRRGPLRHLLPGARRDRRGASPPSCSSSPTSCSRTPARCCPGCPTARAARPAPSSCGRTGTAPTRCSWRCCAAPA